MSLTTCVRLYGGGDLTLELNESETIDTVKAKVAKESGMAVETFELECEGQILEGHVGDGCLYEDCEVVMRVRKDVVAKMELAAMGLRANLGCVWKALGDEAYSEEGKAGIMQAMVDCNPRILTDHDNWGNTAVFYAVSKRCLPALITLHDNGADISLINCSKQNLAMWEGGFAPSLPLLREWGLDLEEPQFYTGTTPMMWAARCDKPDSIAMLVSLGCNIEKRDRHGNTALIWAARSTSGTRTLLTLIEAGADVHVVDNSGRNAMWWARVEERPAQTEVLRQHGVQES